MDYEAIVAASARRNTLTPDRLRSLTSYPYSKEVSV
jgi:hypothetical protein